MSRSERRMEQRRQAFARRVLVDGHLVASGQPHGRSSTYKNHGCRCQPCRAAHAQAIAAARARRHIRTVQNGGIAPTRTHGSTTYANWRCRCEVCVRDWAEQGRRTRRQHAA